MNDPQFNEVETNSLESIGKKKLKKKITNSGVGYHASTKKGSKKYGIRKFAKVKQ